MTADEAYAEAGFKPDRGNASRLTANDNVRARVGELQAGAATRSEITVANLTAELLRIAAKGEPLGEAPGLSVARAALMDAAKLNGLLIERTENRNTVYSVSDEPMTEEEWARGFAGES